MSPRRGTFLFGLIFLSVDLAYSQTAPGKVAELYPNFRGPLPQLGNPLSTSELLSAAQRLLLNPQRPIFQEVIPQPLNIEPAVVVSPPCPEGPIIYPDFPIPNTQIPCSTVSPAIAEVCPVESLPQFTVPQYYAPPPGPISQDCLSSMIPLGPISQPVSFPEVIYGNTCNQIPELAQFYTTPVQVPYITAPVANIPTAEYYPTINVGQIEVPSVIESVPIVYPDIGTNVIEAIPVTCTQQPLSLQINMPPTSEPIITITSPASAPIPTPIAVDYNTAPSLMPMVPPAPLIVMERSKSSLKSLLPILLIAMCDGGCNNGGNCCGGSNIPIPYPIPIPTNNPIITSKGTEGTSKSKDGSSKDTKGTKKGKSKSTSDGV